MTINVLSCSVYKMASSIRELYTKNSSSFAFAGADIVRRSEEGKKFISRNELVEELKREPAYLYHRPCVRKFARRFISVPTLNHQFGSDLIEIKHPGSNYNYRYIIGIVDHFSRSAWMEPLKTKSATEVLAAIRKIFDRTGRKCKYFFTDEGKEYVNNTLKSYFESEGIHHFVSSSSTKCCINERWNRTIMSRIQRYLSHANTKRFVNLLPQFEEQYNNSYCRTIKTLPSKVTVENAPEIWSNIYSAKLKKLKRDEKPKFKVGDYVLIPVKKAIFKKGYEKNWDSHVYKIIEVKSTSPISYVLEDEDGDRIRGIWYSQELLKIPEK